MQKTRYLESLIHQQLFRFHRLVVQGIDNEAVARIFSSAILAEEYCLFSNTIRNGDEYFRLLHSLVIHALENRQSLPVVRFADGEYAFYRFTLGCNGLYKQAESVEAIKRVMPLHIKAMEHLANHGLFAPLVFPGNSHIPSQNFFSFKKQKRDSTGAEFLDFLHTNNIKLSGENYIPFYAIYAYLSSEAFASAMNGKNICILNSDYNKESCIHWFAQFGSHPHLTFVDIPAEYVATRWEEDKKGVLAKIPPDTDLCLAGAGVGALLVCVDVAKICSLPVIDAGHVLNMMNDRVDKSNGARLYTLRKNE
ncbi:MAG: hypothetical protein HGB33_00310 [Syntrophaceae bacterium]|nr:hypothetical protein [Syntrophaceae bacterium]